MIDRRAEAELELKLPAKDAEGKDIPYSNVSVKLGLSALLEGEDYDEASSMMESVVERLVSKYHEQVIQRIRETDSDTLGAIESKIRSEYEGKLRLAKEEIVKLRGK